jgi:hypothetical protein
MVAEQLRRSNREWFIDRRDRGRRLQVTWHRDARTAVLSIWHGETCSATFQLPIEDAARLIGHLAEGLSNAVVECEWRTTPAPETWATRLVRRLRRTRADIIPFRRR